MLKNNSDSDIKKHNIIQNSNINTDKNNNKINFSLIFLLNSL